MGTVFILGAFIIQVSGPDSSGESRVLQFGDGSEVVVTAHVTKEGTPQEEGGNVRQRLDLETEQMGHHGSATSTIPQLLTAVHPHFALISVGARNTYGHPRGDVLAWLAAAHVLTYRTDLDGAVTFYLDGQTVSAVLP
jgi:beta-lactamase superfamily II metal-dependent hydrolase